ncbi:DUF305 domain-containing protein [Allonocardiopsis opalescens]|uniref:Uncharacterized protein (DUF305 family) n=1 Tax=Allonocardiopsis opalescens TaxID=1144618 RepID=A0A2T0PVH0_9ACTN|nr:DUF305 domain-containing protein [Allonocardiopsis opalescens]PRX95521.1 uncharacterized protein (DUF305 family) [Allonocardiopsis opalescens]
MGSARTVAAVVLAALCLGAAGCAAEEPDPDAVPVLNPGAPGDSPQPADPERIEELNDPIQHNEADVEYMRAMIAHHGQALEMTALVPDRAEDDGVVAIAERIEAAQGPEIDAMDAWLENNVYQHARANPNHRNYCGLDGAADHHGNTDCDPVDHSAMPGMITPEQLADLEAAEGAAFDELFVQLMIAHHEGAIEMAQDLLVEGRDTQARQMAADVVADQTAEIARMHELPGG